MDGEREWSFLLPPLWIRNKLTKRNATHLYDKEEDWLQRFLLIASSSEEYSGGSGSPTSAYKSSMFGYYLLRLTDTCTRYRSRYRYIGIGLSTQTKTKDKESVVLWILLSTTLMLWVECGCQDKRQGQGRWLKFKDEYIIKWVNRFAVANFTATAKESYFFEQLEVVGYYCSWLSRMYLHCPLWSIVNRGWVTHQYILL